MHVARRMLATGAAVFGIDNLNSYYDPNLKLARLRELESYPNFRFEKVDVADRGRVRQLFEDNAFRQVVHLAAQAGVRYSLVDPHAYVDSNLTGFVNILEGCRHAKCEHLVYASSSSVYGASTRVPFRTCDDADHPLSLYGATKRANELMAHSYSHLFGLPTTGLRFFTVYGPWGRPDMAMWLFTEAILAGKPIRLFNHGDMRRDFTYVDDVSEAVARLVGLPATADPAWSGREPDRARSNAPWRIYNIGNSHPINISEVVRILERELGRKARCELVAMQAGDVPETCADVSDLEQEIGFRPTTSIDRGIQHFVAWYRRYRETQTTGLSPGG